jgi:rRNA processing protein Krr1/Pno1
LDNGIELISDGDGLAVIGESSAVERFLATLGLPSRDLGLPRLSKVLNFGAAGSLAASAHTASRVVDSARWVRLTEESAREISEYGLTPTKTPGISHAMIGRPGASKSWIQLDKGPGQLPANPTMLAGAPALMAQLAMQQAMDEITDYLAAIDAKLDDVLRAQKDSVLAQMIGIGLQIEEAMTIREHVGRVNEVTWSKVQDAAGTIADTQAYALLQLDALAEKLERKSTVAEVMKTANDAEAKTREWLAVLARCFQLQEGIAILELDRVLETAPDDLTGHRLGLKAARQDRLDTISRSTERLVSRIQAAATTANSRVLFNPIQSPAVVQASANVTASVGEFHDRLGIGAAQHSVETRRWAAAAAEIRDRARTKGADAVGAGKRFGTETRERASSATDKVASRFVERARRRRGPDDDAAGEP